jgi:hypothetical protein
MFAQGRQSHVSSVNAVTLRHAQPKLKHLAMDWANQTASDGVRQAHGMPPMERTQLSLEQSECLFGPRAGIQKVEICWQKKINSSLSLQIFYFLSSEHSQCKLVQISKDGERTDTLRLFRTCFC